MNIWDPLSNTCCPRKEFHPSTHQAHSSKEFQVSFPNQISSMDSNMHSQFERSLSRDNSLAEVLGLKTVEKVKDLCRAYGIRTTRAGTNGGRKAKSELINDLLAAGVTRIDDGFVKSMGKEKRKRTAPSAMPSAILKQELAAAAAAAAAAQVASALPIVVDEVKPSPVEVKDTSAGRLDSLAEVACLALLEHTQATTGYDPTPPRYSSTGHVYRPFTSLAHARQFGQVSSLDNQEQDDQALSWEQVNASSHPASHLPGRWG